MFFANKKEKELIDAFFESIAIIETNKAIAEHVILYRKSKIQHEKTIKHINLINNIEI